MDKYHIYEEIGKGEFSQIFKGREKKKIEYVAIKRIEKSVMSKIVSEVQVMHKLHSAHVLKFYDWYETRNNLWLILEYCTGADLESLLKQDGHLPETSVRIFGLDILAGLKYLHSLGLLHCDLRPCNFLVDEYGILKISDFKFTRKVPSETLQDSSITTRGTPAYMAPELFTAEGVHSMQSDFWAVGCILYQLRRGVLPFGDITTTTTMNQLIENVRSVEPINCPIITSTTHSSSIPPVSAELADLVLWLLEKAPMNRCDWMTLSAHPFWAPNNPLPPSKLTPHHIYDQYISGLLRKQTEQVESTFMKEYGLTHDDPTSRSHLHPQQPQSRNTTPLKMPQHVESTPVRVAVDRTTATTESSTASSSSSSLPASSHSQPKEVSVEVKQESIESNSALNNKKNKNTSSLLDVTTHMHVPVDDADRGTRNKPSTTKQSSSDSKQQSSSSSSSSAVHQSEVKGVSGPSHASPPRDKLLSKQITPERSQSGAQQAAFALTAAANSDVSARKMVLLPAVRNLFPDTAGTDADVKHAKVEGINAAKDDMMPHTAVTGHHPPSFHAASNSNSATNTAVAVAVEQQQQQQQLSGQQLSTHTLLQHPSDIQIKPIVGNKNIESSLEKFAFKETSLPFVAYACDSISKHTQTELEAHLTIVYKALQKTFVVITTNNNNSQQTHVANASNQSSLQDRIRILSYLFSIAAATEIANIILNTHFLQLILKIIKSSLVYASPSYGSNTTNGLNYTRSTALNSTHSGGGSSSSSSSSSTGALHVSMNNAALHCRVLAATVLGSMLRYATFLHPPPSTSSSSTVRSKDDHIIIVLSSMLKASSKLDVKLRRRVMAAFGEVIFYITAQADHADTTDHSEPHKWLLPSSVLETLTDQLREDNGDEVTKHYAAKTIENVFAQGGLRFKRRLVSLDTALRLLDLSLHSKNEALQASCGMALSHMILIVLTAYRHYTDSNAGGISVTTTTTTATGGGGGGGTTTPLTDIFNSSSPLRGAKFLAKVLEKGGLPGMVEVLKDGPAKLQQAYLNIINYLFSSPMIIVSTEEVGDVGSNRSKAATTATTAAATAVVVTPSNEDIKAVNVVLRMTRTFFVKSSSMASVLMHLIEQGGLSAVRSKALLAAQLISRYYSGMLALLAERRLPAFLLRVIAPTITELEAKSSSSRGPMLLIQLEDMSYLTKTAFSMLFFIRDACKESALIISEQLQLLISNPNSITLEHSINTYDSPTKATNTTAATSTIGGTQFNSTARKWSPLHYNSTPESPDRRDRANGTMVVVDTAAASSLVGCNLGILRSAAEMLCVGVSAASQPLLRRLILASDGLIVRYVSQAIRALFEVPTILPKIISSSSTDAVQRELMIVMEVTEQACLIALETLSQIEFPDSDQVVNDEGRPAAGDDNTGCIMLNSKRSSLEFMCEVVKHLVPSTALLYRHESGDIRVVVAAAFRRMIPTQLKSVLMYFEEADNKSSRIAMDSDLSLTMDDVHELLKTLVSHCPALLADHAPIPQYTVRLLSDVILTSPTIADAVVKHLQSTGSISHLLRLLKIRRTAANDEEMEVPSSNSSSSSSYPDPQLVVLIRYVFERNGAAALLQCDVATSIASVCISIIYGKLGSFINSSYSDIIKYPATMVHQMLDIDLEDLMVSIDLLHLILHFVIRALSTADEKDRNSTASNGKNIPIPSTTASPARNNGVHYMQAEAYRRLIAPLRAVSPALLVMFHYAHHCIYCKTTLLFKEGDTSIHHQHQQQQQHHQQENSSTRGDEPPISNGLDVTSYLHLLDSGSRCLGILFDLYPNDLSLQLSSRQPLTLDSLQSNTANHSSASPVAVASRDVLSTLIRSSYVEIKVRIRIIKILNGTCKAALSSIAASSSSNISNNNTSSSSQPQLQVHPRVKDLVTTNPLSSAVMECCDVDSIAAGVLKAVAPATGSNSNSSNISSRVSREDIASLVNFAVQLRDLSRRL